MKRIFNRENTSKIFYLGFMVFFDYSINDIEIYHLFKSQGKFYRVNGKIEQSMCPIEFYEPRYSTFHQMKIDEYTMTRDMINKNYKLVGIHIYKQPDVALKVTYYDMHNTIFSVGNNYMYFVVKDDKYISQVVSPNFRNKYIYVEEPRLAAFRKFDFLQEQPVIKIQINHSRNALTDFNEFIYTI